MIEVPNDLRDVLPRQRAERGALRHKPPDQSIRVLARAALPRVMRLGKEDACSGFLLHVAPECELAAAVIRDGEGRQILEAFRNDRRDDVGVAVGNEVGNMKSAFTVYMHEEPEAILAYDGIAFPIADTQSSFNFLGPLVDGAYLLCPTTEKFFRLAIRATAPTTARQV